MSSTKVPGRRYDFRKTRRWQKVAKAVLVRDLYRCHWCGGTATQADHIVPASKGGSWYDPSNIVASCRRCNSARGNRRSTAPERSHRLKARSVFGSLSPHVDNLGKFANTPPRSPWQPIVGDYSRKAAG